jgi:pimeloyl-ACP methyl ester carboxylesterase
VEDQTIGLVSGRTVGFADYGIPDATAVLWCHGGPGIRLEPAYLRRVASEAGLRIIAIDRPGYGLSTPQPGRTIAGWVPEALAVADHLGIGPFAAVGVSTGGAYALALDLPGPGPIGRRCPAASKATQSRHHPRSGTLGRLTH